MSSPVAVVVMGVSGAGKSTVAIALAQRLGWELQEGDELHSAANIAKMAAGEPLTDDDRQPWLEQVRARIDQWLAAGTSGVVTCSALKRSYRDRLATDGVVFAALQLDRAALAERLARRTGHFMGVDLLDSQLATYETPTDEESMVSIDADQDLDSIVDQLVSRLHLSGTKPGR